MDLSVNLDDVHDDSGSDVEQQKKEPVAAAKNADVDVDVNVGLQQGETSQRRTFKSQVVTLAVSMVILVVFLLSGAAVYHKLEGPQEQTDRDEAKWLHWSMDNAMYTELLDVVQDAGLLTPSMMAVPDEVRDGVVSTVFPSAGADDIVDVTADGPASAVASATADVVSTTIRVIMTEAKMDADGNLKQSVVLKLSSGTDMWIPVKMKPDGRVGVDNPNPSPFKPAEIGTGGGTENKALARVQVLANLLERSGLLVDDDAELYWDFRGSMFFCLTVITTIGYGVTAPQTDGGRAFTFVYGLLSVALVGYVLSSISDLLITAWAYSFVTLRRTISRLVHSDAHNAAAASRAATKTRAMHTSSKVFVATVTIVAVHVIGAFVFAHTEGWSFFEALYFCFVTLSTIGFGDFVPHTLTGRSFAIIYVFLGVGVFAFVATALAERTLRRFYEFLARYEDFYTPAVSGDRIASVDDSKPDKGAAAAAADDGGSDVSSRLVDHSSRHSRTSSGAHHRHTGSMAVHSIQPAHPILSTLGGDNDADVNRS